MAATAAPVSYPEITMLIPSRQRTIKTSAVGLARFLGAGAAVVGSAWAKIVLAVSDGGLGATANTAGLKSGTGDLSGKIGAIVGSLLGLVGTVFVVLMIYAGVLWMTAAGDDDKIKKAKDLIIGAVIGLVIIFSAYAITSFVLTSVIKAG